MLEFQANIIKKRGEMAIKREKLSELVRKKLRKIVKDKPTGFKLPSENELAKQFAVSRSTIREAVSTLIAERLILVRQGKGLFVRSEQKDPVLGAKESLEDKDKLWYAYSISNLLESSNIIDIASDISEVQVSKLEKNLKRFVDCTEKEVNKQVRLQQLMEIDHEFHFLLASFSHNSFLLAFLDYLFTRIRESRCHFLDSAEKEQRMIWEHRSIVEALSKGTGLAAKALMQGHLENYLEYLGYEQGNFQKK